MGKRFPVGTRIFEPDACMVGTVMREWNMNDDEWWIEVEWDRSTMQAEEVVLEEDEPDGRLRVVRGDGSLA